MLAAACDADRASSPPGFGACTAGVSNKSFSHLWIVFWCHAIADSPHRDTVHPPRLGGNRRVGAFASRSPFRPNPIGLSLVELRRVDGLALELGGGDFLDGTPVLDVEPYLPWADTAPAATAGWAEGTPSRLEVDFSEEALAALAGHPRGEQLRELAGECLSLDPRPAYDAEAVSTHAMRLADIELRFTAGPIVYASNR